jgi:hypothetical protein
MYDFYDVRGTLLKQIDMHSRIKWELVTDPQESPEGETALIRSSAGLPNQR